MFGDGMAALDVPDGNTMKNFRAKQWPGDLLANDLGGIFSLLAHAPRAGIDFLAIQTLDVRQRIDLVISRSAFALQSRPQLAHRLREIVPSLAKEKLRRNGADPQLFEAASLPATKHRAA